MAPVSISLALVGLVCLFTFRASQKLRTFIRRRAIIRQRRCEPPPSTPSLDPFLGLDSVVRALRSSRENRRSLTLKDQLDTYGLTFQSILWGSTKIFSAEPQNLQAIFSTDFESYGVEPLRLFGFEPLTGKGIMTTDGAPWAHSRVLIRAAFNRACIADLSDFDVHVKRMIDIIPKDGSTVDLQPIFARLALDSSTDFLFGESAGTLTSRPFIDAKKFLQAYDYGQMGVGKRLQLPKWNILTYDRKFWESCKLTHKFVEKYVAQVTLELACPNEEKKTKLVLAYQLAKEVKNQNEVRNQLLNVFLPGHDALGVALTNVFFNLARHPDVWDKLHQEVHRLESTELTFESLKSMKYLQNVLSETMRLNPVISSIGRAALRDTILPVGGGASGKSPIFVKKGDEVKTSFYALHRRKDIYGDNADSFDPDRWLRLRPRHWGYLPFGGGPRVCPGQQLVLTQLAFTVTRMVQSFQGLENRDPVWDFVEQYKLTTESKNGAKVRLTQVRNNG